MHNVEDSSIQNISRRRINSILGNLYLSSCLIICSWKSIDKIVYSNQIVGFKIWRGKWEGNIVYDIHTVNIIYGYIFFSNQHLVYPQQVL